MMNWARNYSDTLHIVQTLPSLTFTFLGHLKNHMRRKHFTTDGDVIDAVSEWLTTQPRDFHAKGINDFVTRWKKCIEKDGDCVEKCKKSK